MSIENLFALFMGLGGIGALVAAVINILKTVGVVKDGQASTVSAGINLVLMAALLILKVYKPEVDIAGLDQQAAMLASALVTIFGFVWQLISAKIAHAALSGVPVIGKSFSGDANAEEAKARSFEERIIRRG